MKNNNTVSLSTTFFYMYIMHNSVCITSPSFFLLRPVVQEKMVKNTEKAKIQKVGRLSLEHCTYDEKFATNVWGRGTQNGL